MFSLAIYTQAAVTNRLVIFSLFLLSLKAQRYFFKKVYNLFSAIFSSSTKTAKLTQPRPQGFQATVPFSDNSMCYSYYVNLRDTANVFQIWSTLVGYRELAGGFEPIRHG